MRRWLRTQLSRAYRALQPQLDPEAKALIGYQAGLLNEAAARESSMRADYVERSSELMEARQMAGAGPWLTHEGRESVGLPGRFRESDPIGSVGALSDIDLMLSNVEWRREVNLAWLEFSRWGIQQIILVSRLYYIKNPWIQRGINVAAEYVFGRGVEVSSPDEAANAVLQEFFERNKSTLGQIALTDLERRKYYDGNLFFCFFADKVSTGLVNVRTIDATEIMDIVTNPEDTDEPWYYRRVWTERVFESVNGAISTQRREAWYPALKYEPADKPETINASPVMWKSPVLHRRCGSVSKWLFGCPLVYAALDWAKSGKKFLEACLTVKLSLASIAMTITTKGGQQAMEGIKQQIQTNVGTGTGLWDTNPPPIAGSIFGAGPGTKLEAFDQKGGNPEEVREYRNMTACVLGIPPTFLADLETANLATATTLDRPTELNFLQKQEAWREDLITICMYALKVSGSATSGKLREAYPGGALRFREATRVRQRDGRLVEAAVQVAQPGEIIVSVNFPAIREGDVPALITATCEAIEKGGIDPKVGVTQLYDLLPGVDDGVQIAEEQFPGSVAKRQKAKDEAAAAALAKPVLASVKPTEALARRLARQLVEAVDSERNGAQHPQ